jgi:lysophospholipase L1-like esterase
MKRKIVVAALLICVAFSSASFAVTKWACVGDSITAGWKLKDPQKYYYKLGVLLGSEYEVRNYGHSARTMLRDPIEGVSYWISPMFTDSQAWQPDIVSIMLGTNDAHPNNWPLLADEYKKDAIDMVNVYKNLASNPRVILMKAPPAKNDGREPALSEVNEILESVAQATGVELVDVYTAIDGSHPVPYSENQLYKDPIHLSAISHTIVAELLYDQVINGPVCGDENCDFGEDRCNCPADCGTPPETESSCADGIDEDCDLDTDCADVDCDDDLACPVCGDGACDFEEDQCNCTADCGTPPETEASCTDGIDEDCDLETDCADADCDDDSACIAGPVIFSDDFESGSFAAGGWSVVAGSPTVHEQAPYTGMYGVKFQRFAAIEKSLSTVGSSGITVEYDRRTLNYDPEDFFEVEWFDGSEWYLLEATQDTSWSRVSFTLPTIADNNPNFRIRFTSNANRPTDKVFLDNVEVLD